MTKNNFKESIHQEFERFMRDEMDDSEREKYIKSQNYKKMINLLTNTLKDFKNKQYRYVKDNFCYYFDLPYNIYNL